VRPLRRAWSFLSLRDFVVALPSGMPRGHGSRDRVQPSRPVWQLPLPRADAVCLVHADLRGTRLCCILCAFLASVSSRQSGPARAAGSTSLLWPGLPPRGRA
jgi:hypothetical protein